MGLSPLVVGSPLLMSNGGGIMALLFPTQLRQWVCWDTVKHKMTFQFVHLSCEGWGLVSFFVHQKVLPTNKFHNHKDFYECILHTIDGTQLLTNKKLRNLLVKVYLLVDKYFSDMRSKSTIILIYQLYQLPAITIN